VWATNVRLDVVLAAIRIYNAKTVLARVACTADVNYRCVIPHVFPSKIVLTQGKSATNATIGGVMLLVEVLVTLMTNVLALNLTVVLVQMVHASSELVAQNAKLIVAVVPTVASASTMFVSGLELAMISVLSIVIVTRMVLAKDAVLMGIV